MTTRAILQTARNELARGLDHVDKALAELDAGVVAPPVEPVTYSYGGEPIRKGIDNDPAKLLKPFADRLELLFQRLRERGLDPVLFEGWRSFERAQRLSAKGSGIPSSMHCYGAAGDILEEHGMWSASPEFWNAIGEEAEMLGLVWGGRWLRKDRPHVQAIEVRDQARFRKMTDKERLAFVAARLG